MQIQEPSRYSLEEDELTIESTFYLDCYMTPEMLSGGSFPVEQAGFLYVDFRGGSYRKA